MKLFNSFLLLVLVVLFFCFPANAQKTQIDFDLFTTLCVPQTNKVISIYPAFNGDSMTQETLYRQLIALLQSEGWEKSGRQSVGFFRVLVGIDASTYENNFGPGRGVEVAPCVAGESLFDSDENEGWAQKIISHINLQFEKHGNGMYVFGCCE